jgi:SPP1 gp7 family putative phage head morphogenesis protein
MNHRAWILALDKFEVLLRLKVAIERIRTLRAAAKSYAASQSIAGSAKADHQRKLDKILLAHYKQVMPFFISATRRQVKKQNASLEIKQLSDFDALVAEWASTEALRKARLIAGTSFDDVEAAITEGLLEGASNTEIAKAIRGKSGLTAYRASVVARTETHNAATYASLQSIREFERETGAKFMKRWVATNDQRTRDTHAEMRGSDPIPVDDKFYVGGEWMDRPGDSSASPENIIHCRCQVVFSEE